MTENTDTTLKDPIDNGITLMALNKQIKDVLKEYLPPDATKLDSWIRFDVAEKEHPPASPTLCVFLYDIQEDLSLREGRPRQYNPGNSQFEPRQVHIRCCYLLTYWDTSKESEGMAANSQSMIVMNRALQALLNIEFPGMPAAYLRIIPPSEHLSSLGNFWQSLGDKPRLCLNFTVTIPYPLQPKPTVKVDPEKAPPVVSTQVLSDQQDLDALARNVRNQFITQVLKEVSAEEQSALREQLMRLEAYCDKVTQDGKISDKPVIHITGYLTKPYETNVTAGIPKLNIQDMVIDNRVVYIDVPV